MELGRIRAGRRRSWRAALAAPLCAAFGLLVASSGAAEGLPDLPATIPGATERLPDLPTSSAPAVQDQPNASDASAVADDQPDASATTAWYDCARGEAARLDDGRSDAGTIADALATSCQAQWDASKTEQCQTSSLTPQACALLADKLDANRRSYDIKVVLAQRARKAQAAAP